jgi:hypothetical protein
MSNTQSLRRLVTWLKEDRAAIDIAGQVTIQTARSGAGPLTHVAIDHRLSCPLPEFAGWRITTIPTFLPSPHFASEATAVIKKASKERGRSIYCHDRDLDDEVTAAMSYHVDRRANLPVFITMVATRVDGTENLELQIRSIAGAIVLKQYVHAISGTLGRGPEVHIELPAAHTERYATELGFRRARAIKRLRVSGVHMAQPPLG